MLPVDVINLVRTEMSYTREDIIRAKAHLLTVPVGRADKLAETWLRQQGAEMRGSFNPGDSSQIQGIVRACSLRKALYQAVFELVASGDLILTEPFAKYAPTVIVTSGDSQNGFTSAPFLLETGFAEPKGFERITPAAESTDPDIFLQGIDCKSLHPGIREGIEQALLCFRRQLYMPAVAMLAAASEAAWTECGTAVAAKLDDPKLAALFANPRSSISNKVAELSDALDGAVSKPLLKSAGIPVAKVRAAQVWADVLMDRRNALHWTKARNFVADHSGTAGLLLGAPIHISTLEAVRLNC